MSFVAALLRRGIIVVARQFPSISRVIDMLLDWFPLHPADPQTEIGLGRKLGEICCAQDASICAMTASEQGQVRLVRSELPNFHKKRRGSV